MTVGLMPIVGIPLPFISKGSSLLVTFSLTLILGFLICTGFLFFITFAKDEKISI